jgi:hypothetical protein
VDERVKNKTINTVVRGFKKRFMTGEFSPGETQSQLINFGVADQRAQELVRGWTGELTAKYKGPTIALLCKWWTRGLITIDEFERRVVNIGHPVLDAVRIVSACVLDETEKRAKEAQAAKDKMEAKLAAQKKAERAAARAAFPCKNKPQPVCPAGVSNPYGPP